MLASLALVFALSVGGYLAAYLGARGLRLLVHDATTDLSPASFGNCEHAIRDTSAFGLDVAFATLAAMESRIWLAVEPRWDFVADPRGGCGGTP